MQRGLQPPTAPQAWLVRALIHHHKMLVAVPGRGAVPCSVKLPRLSCTSAGGIPTRAKTKPEAG